MFARIEDITKTDIPQVDSLSNYDGLKIVREIVKYDSVEGRYHPSLDWVQIDPEDNISQEQTYDPETGTFGDKPSLPSLSISLSDSQIINDGSDSVTITISISGVRPWDPDSWDGTLKIDDETFSETFSATNETTETITTTKSAGSSIEISVGADGLQDATDSMEVVSA